MASLYGIQVKVFMLEHVPVNARVNDSAEEVIHDVVLWRGESCCPMIPWCQSRCFFPFLLSVLLLP